MQIRYIGCFADSLSDCICAQKAQVSSMISALSCSDIEFLLEKKDKGKRQVVFLDELPWMDTQRSGFLSAFEAF